MKVPHTILNKVIHLQALHEQGYKEATALRYLMEGGVKNTPPEIKRRRKSAVKAVIKRNLKLAI